MAKRLFSILRNAFIAKYLTFIPKNGAYGGWLINHKILIGAGGYALATSHDGYSMDNESISNNKLKMGYGGLMLGYTFLEKKRFHVTTNVLIGAGAVVNAYKTSYHDQYGDNWHSDEESGFRVSNLRSILNTVLRTGFRLLPAADIAI